MTEHAFWITSRAAGIIALLAASLAVALGLLMSTPLRRRLPEARVLHEALSLATMVALVVHAVALIGDGYFKASVADITIPFVRGFWMGLGIVAGWLFLILGLSYYLAGADRPGALARAAPLHRGGLGARRRARGDDGHRRGHDLVPGRGHAGRRPRRRAAGAPLGPGGGDMSHRRFSCFGSRCGLWVTGAGAAEAVEDARRCLENWHVRFSRFIASSELSRLNADPREVVPVSTTMTQLLRAVREAAEATGGLVDGTLARELEDAGYRSDLAAPLPLAARAAPGPAAPPRDARGRGGSSASTAGRSRARPGSRSTAAGWPRACSPT